MTTLNATITTTLDTDEGTVERRINSVAQAICWGVPVYEIRETLVNEGVTEEQAYLIYVAAKVLIK